MRLLVLVGLCACNQWYGLDGTELAPRDAPTTCPTVGTDLAFSKTVRQIVFRNCTEYTVSPSRMTAAARCSTGVELGTPDGEDLVPEPALKDSVFVPAPLYYVFNVSPHFVDDTRMVVLEGEIDGGFYKQRFVEYRRDVTWQRHAMLPMYADTDQPVRLGQPARVDGNTHLFTAAGGVVEEWIEDAAGWRRASSFDATDLGIPVIHRISMSSDALRLLFSVMGPLELETYYTDRASLDSPFRPAVPIEAPPVIAGMTADCARLYFSGLETVFYVDRK